MDVDKLIKEKRLYYLHDFIVDNLYKFDKGGIVSYKYIMEDLEEYQKM